MTIFTKRFSPYTPLYSPSKCLCANAVLNTVYDKLMPNVKHIYYIVGLPFMSEDYFHIGLTNISVEGPIPRLTWEYHNHF